MDKYTPHTDDVRMAYIHGASQDYYVANKAHALQAEFDRWLAEHFREVKAEAWDEGARWGAVEFQSLGGQIRDESQVNLVAGDNPYREETE